MMAAAAQYANRPADERFATIDALINAARADRYASKERRYALRDLQATSTTATENSPAAVVLQSPKGTAELTHWSFSQLARTVGAPAAYLRTLPATLAASCINHGIGQTPSGTDVNILAKQNGHGPIVRACTSETYGRLWDEQLYSAVRDSLLRGSHTKFRDGLPTWSGETAGWYRGDRDSFGITVDGGSIVDDPSASQGNGSSGQMYRGLIIRNSEVGAAAVSVSTFLFRYICGNHIIWGAQNVAKFRRRHVGMNALRDTMREIVRLAREWTTQSASQDQALIKVLIDHEIAHTKEAVIDELRKVGYTKDQAIAAYDLTERTENASPRSFWGLAQGTTRLSQTESDGHMDERQTIDDLAGQLLAIGVKKYGALAAARA